MSFLWNDLVTSAFGHLRPEPAPQITPHERESAEQFAADMQEVVDAIADEQTRWSRYVAEGRRSMPALTPLQREELLTTMWASHATIKSMREGSI